MSGYPLACDGSQGDSIRLPERAACSPNGHAAKSRVASAACMCARTSRDGRSTSRPALKYEPACGRSGVMVVLLRCAHAASLRCTVQTHSCTCERAGGTAVARVRAVLLLCVRVCIANARSEGHGMMPSHHMHTALIECSCGDSSASKSSSMFRTITMSASTYTSFS